MYDTRTQKSSRLITLSDTEYEMVAENGKLYFLDSIGVYTCLVSYDFESGKTNVLAKICNEERMWGYAEGLTRYDRYLIYFTTQETASDMQTTMCGYDLITRRVYTFGIVSYDILGYMATAPKNLYVDNYRVRFENGGVRLERLKTDIWISITMNAIDLSLPVIPSPA